MNKLLIHLVLITTAVLLHACTERPVGHIIKLASGKEVRVVQITTIHFSSDRPAWALRYETTIPFENARDLETEVCEVWDYFLPDIERSGHKTAIITAVEKALTGFFRHVKQENILFKQEADGRWRSAGVSLCNDMK